MSTKNARGSASKASKAPKKKKAADKKELVYVSRDDLKYITGGGSATKHMANPRAGGLLSS